MCHPKRAAACLKITVVTDATAPEKKTPQSTGNTMSKPENRMPNEHPRNANTVENRIAKPNESKTMPSGFSGALLGVVVSMFASRPHFDNLAFEHFQRFLDQRVVFEIILVEGHRRGGFFLRSS